MKSQTFVVPPLLGCLSAAEKYLRNNSLLGHEVAWTGITDDQRAFVDRFVVDIGEVDSLKDVLEQIAHKDSKVINQWLREHGFTIQLSSPDGPLSFCVASILDVLVNWLKVGQEVSILDKYPGVKLKGENSGVTILTGEGEPVAAIRTKRNSEWVYMRMIDDVPDGPLGIADVLKAMPEDLHRDNSYDSVVFPMLDYDQHVDVSWLVGLQTGNARDDWYVHEAIQQTKFRLNETGARAQSGAAMMMRGRSIELPKKTLVIDRPFLLWIERGGIRLPLFAGVFAEDSWKKPANLD